MSKWEFKYRKSKSGSLIFVVTGENTHQILGYSTGIHSSHIIIQGEKGNEFAVRKILTDADYEEATHEEVAARLQTILRDAIRTAQFHKVETPGMDEMMEYLDEQLKTVTNKSSI
jgi:hypothetical protein